LIYLAVFGVIYIATVVTFIYLLIRKDADIGKTTEMFERIVSRQMDTERSERESERTERDKLLQRIQAPEIATIPEVEQTQAYVPFDDFAGMNDQVERVQAANE
jgi:hypothetical protein